MYTHKGDVWSCMSVTGGCNGSMYWDLSTNSPVPHCLPLPLQLAAEQWLPPASFSPPVRTQRWESVMSSICMHIHTSFHTNILPSPQEREDVQPSVVLPYSGPWTAAPVSLDFHSWPPVHAAAAEHWGKVTHQTYLVRTIQVLRCAECLLFVLLRLHGV